MSVENNNNQVIDNQSATESPEFNSQFDVVEDLTRFFAAQTGETVEGDENPVDEDAVSDESADQESADESESAEETADQTVAEDDLPVEDLGESDFSEFEGEAEPDPINPEDYPNADKLNELYPRQQRKLIETAAEAIEAKRERDELYYEIGGKEAIAPVVGMAKAARDGDAPEYFRHLVDFGTSQALLDVSGHSTFLALIKAKEWAAQPDEDIAEIGNAMLAQTDAVLAGRFGEGINAEVIDQLVQFQKIGLIEKFQEWIEQDYVDSEDFYTLKAALKKPDEFISIRKKAQATEIELENTRRQLEQQEESKLSETEQKFEDLADKSAIEKLENAWKTSVLRDIPSDTKEIKDAKTEFKTLVIEKAQKAFRKSEEYKQLVAAYKRGDGGTKKFSESFNKALNQQILSVKEQNSKYEAIVARLYGKKRNVNLPNTKKLAATQNSQSPLNPTETVQTEKQPMTVAEITAQMARDIAALG